MTRRHIVAVIGVMLMAATLTGCFNPFRPKIGSGVATLETAPKADSPTGVLQRLKWCWENRSITEYEELFTQDFQFVFSDVEASQNPPILRDEEIDIARRLFVDGTVSQPRAQRITLNYGSTTFNVQPDPRPGKTDPWHKQILTQVILRAELQDAIWDVQGQVTFYLVRGDSAAIPDELKTRGFTNEPSHWYIERWEDHTATGEGGSSSQRPDPGAGAAKQVALPAWLSPAAAPNGLSPEIHATWGELFVQFRE